MAVPAQAGGPSVCEHERKLIVNHLTKQYGEHRIGKGMTGHGHVFELFANHDGKSWTIIATFVVQDQMGVAVVKTCLLVAGDEWESYLPLPEVENEQL